MPSQSSGCLDVLECCLHGKICRAGQKEAEDKENKQVVSEQYVNLAEPKSQKKSRQEEAVERLARHLRHVEQQAELRQRRREERRRRRSEREKRKERQEQPLREGSNTDSSYRQLDRFEATNKHERKRSRSFSKDGYDQSGDDFYAMNGTVNVSVPKTPREKPSAPKASHEESASQTANKGDEAGDSRRLSKTSETYKSSAPSFHSDLAKSIYLGVCNFSKAEESVEKRADFRLYHHMVQNPLLDELEPELPLNLVYKTANGSYRHYPVRTRSVLDSTYFYVETGEKRPLHHCSLNHLVRYYQINAQRHPEHHDYADPFPWWEVPS